MEASISNMLPHHDVHPTRPVLMECHKHKVTKGRFRTPELASLMQKKQQPFLMKTSGLFFFVLLVMMN
jgi:hypothetical protein